jgi:hypothetical protein
VEKSGHTYQFSAKTEQFVAKTAKPKQNSNNDRPHALLPKNGLILRKPQNAATFGPNCKRARVSAKYSMRSVHPNLALRILDLAAFNTRTMN